MLDGLILSQVTLYGCVPLINAKEFIRTYFKKEKSTHRCAIFLHRMGQFMCSAAFPTEETSLTHIEIETF